MAMPLLLRGLGRIWALPNSILGALLLGIAVATGGGAAPVAGVIEVHGGLLRRALARFPLGRGGAMAITLGHVVVGTDLATLALTRAHERVHVSQYERWGPLFLPAYGLCSLWAWLRGADPYRDNRFERQAFAAEAAAARSPRPGGGIG